jgi:excisionase family DNA binding protein
MENRTISFEDLPQATSALQGEVQALRSVVEQLVVEIKSSNGKETVEDMIGIDEACRLLGLKKPTVYHKAQKREIKSYKPKGTKKLMFKRSELYEWLESKGISKEPAPDVEAILASLQKGVRHKPGSIK